MVGEGKYIHYCWFGGKPLPKLARKCLESWKKYLPDYEVICWNEKNCNFDECEFVKRRTNKSITLLWQIILGRRLSMRWAVYILILTWR